MSNDKALVAISTPAHLFLADSLLRLHRRQLGRRLSVAVESRIDVGKSASHQQSQNEMSSDNPVINSWPVKGLLQAAVRSRHCRSRNPTTA
jgi:hypothetical protein